MIMPNWAEGNMRIRGKRNNILEFLRSELITCDDDFGVAKSIVVEENRGGWGIMVRKPSNNCNHLYFRGSDRQFAMDLTEGDLDIPLSEGPNQNVDQIVVVEDFEGAWGVDDATFMRYAKTYKIDIRIFVWESGMCWSSVTTYYKDGSIDKESRQYADWLWDSPLPYYGG